MILTNALLQIAFAIIGNYTNAVPIAPELVPTRVEDLSNFAVDNPYAPTELFLTRRNGGTFIILYGVVYMFHAPTSYMGVQGPEDVRGLLGKPVMDEKQAVRMATSIVEALAKGTNPIARIRPRVTSPPPFEGKRVPVYKVLWPKKSALSGFDYVALVEIDARVRQVTRLEVNHPSFYDLECADAIQRQVDDPHGRPWASKTDARPARRLFPFPSTNQVVEAISSWAWLCDRLGVDSSGTTNIDAVNWEGTFLWQNAYLPQNPLECTVKFTNGVHFCSVRGVALSHTGGDAYFVGDKMRFSMDELRAMHGSVNYKWETLAQRLDRALSERVGIPRQQLARYQIQAPLWPPPPVVGSTAFRRVVVAWRDRRSKEANVRAFSAEFDVGSGEIKNVAFADPELIEAIARAQGRSAGFR